MASRVPLSLVGATTAIATTTRTPRQAKLEDATTVLALARRLKGLDRLDKTVIEQAEE